jgi:hypothetical protein
MGNTDYLRELFLEGVDLRTQRSDVVALEGLFDKLKLLATHMRRGEINPFARVIYSHVF